MKVDRNRIFISDLPETATEEAIRSAFSEYGKVVSVEIKERKELGTKNSSLFFAYINIDTDHKTLQQCFKDFSEEKWFGQYIYLQLARESFLDRLKREREENPVTKESESISHIINNGKHDFVPKIKDDSVEKVRKKKKLNSFIELNPTDQVEPAVAKIITNDQVVDILEKKIEEEEDSNIVIKNNRGRTYDKTGLKIASVGNEPIVKITKTKNKVEVNTSEANIKRLQSLKNLKKGYQNQKSLVQAALSKIDIKPKNKIIFDDTEEPNGQQPHSCKDTKKALFENEESEEEFEGNFEVKEQFQGVEGQKLLALQSKYKNDKRFALDSRFLENDNGNDINNSTPEDDDITLEEEKKKEYEILNEILGKKITNLDKKSDSQKKVMLRFDPSQAEHSKFEVKRVVVKNKKKRKKDDNMNEKKHEEKEIPEVSKEIFYKVTDDFKDSLQEKKEFSLLSLFGKSSEQVSDDEEQPLMTVPKNSLVNEKNPFRYDSSDDDNETEEIQKLKNVDTSEKSDLQPQGEIKQRNFWVESFFFKPDDYRLQEGFDFIEKMKSEDRLEFTKLRREVKEVVKAKVRNNQRKNKPFKKKLGGNKRKKMIRMKKAMKR